MPAVEIIDCAQGLLKLSRQLTCSRIVRTAKDRLAIRPEHSNLARHLKHPASHFAQLVDHLDPGRLVTVGDSGGAHIQPILRRKTEANRNSRRQRIDCLAPSPSTRRLNPDFKSEWAGRSGRRRNEEAELALKALALLCRLDFKRRRQDDVELTIFILDRQNLIKPATAAKTTERAQLRQLPELRQEPLAQLRIGNPHCRLTGILRELPLQSTARGPCSPHRDLNTSRQPLSPHPTHVTGTPLLPHYGMDWNHHQSKEENGLKLQETERMEDREGKMGQTGRRIACGEW